MYISVKAMMLTESFLHNNCSSQLHAPNEKFDHEPSPLALTKLVTMLGFNERMLENVTCDVPRVWRCRLPPRSRADCDWARAQRSLMGRNGCFEVARPQFNSVVYRTFSFFTPKSGVITRGRLAVSVVQRTASSNRAIHTSSSRGIQRKERIFV